MCNCTYNYKEYIDNKGVYFEEKKEVENEYKLFKETHNNVVKNCEEILFFIENNIIPLYENTNYYHGIKECLYDISDLEQFYYEQNVDCSDEIDVIDLTQEDIDRVYDVSEVTYGYINKVYMYSYNLLVNLQNDTYSKFFNNKKMIKLWDYRYENLEKVENNNKEIYLFFGGCILN